MLASPTARQTPLARLGAQRWIAWLLLVCALASLGAARRRRVSASSSRGLAVRRPVDLPNDPFQAAAYLRLQSYVDQRDFQGSVLIARGDSVLYERSVQFPKLAPVTGATRFGIASVTKTFTAAAILKLEAQGKLSLSDTLSKFVPGYAKADSITIEQLLNHTSGVRDYVTDPYYPRIRAQPTTLKQFVDWLAARPLDFSPGTQSAYTNSGYALLAYVVERVTGTPYHVWLERQLLTPLGLRDTGPLTAPGAVANLAQGYDAGLLPVGTQTPATFDWSWLAGSGSLYSTPRDLLRWTHAVLRDSTAGLARHLYPYGWGERERHGRKVIEQTGRVAAGYAASVSWLPQDDVTVIVLSNLQSESVGAIARDLETLALGDTLAPFAPRRKANIPETRADALTGRYQLFPNMVLTVRADGSNVWLAGPDGDDLPLDPEGPSFFFFRTLYVPVSFERDSTGGGTAMIWNGQFRGPRVR